VALPQTPGPVDKTPVTLHYWTTGLSTQQDRMATYQAQRNSLGKGEGGEERREERTGGREEGRRGEEREGGGCWWVGEC